MDTEDIMTQYDNLIEKDADADGTTAKTLKMLRSETRGDFDLLDTLFDDARLHLRSRQVYHTGKPVWTLLNSSLLLTKSASGSIDWAQDRAENGFLHVVVEIIGKLCNDEVIKATGLCRDYLPVAYTMSKQALLDHKADFVRLVAATASNIAWYGQVYKKLQPYNFAALLSQNEQTVEQQLSLLKGQWQAITTAELVSEDATSDVHDHVKELLNMIMFNRQTLVREFWIDFGANGGSLTTDMVIAIECLNKTISNIKYVLENMACELSDIGERDNRASVIDPWKAWYCLRHSDTLNPEKTKDEYIQDADMLKQFEVEELDYFNVGNQLSIRKTTNNVFSSSSSTMGGKVIETISKHALKDILARHDFKMAHISSDRNAITSSIALEHTFDRGFQGIRKLWRSVMLSKPGGFYKEMATGDVFYGLGGDTRASMVLGPIIVAHFRIIEGKPHNFYSLKRSLETCKIKWVTLENLADPREKIEDDWRGVPCELLVADDLEKLDLPRENGVFMQTRPHEHLLEHSILECLCFAGEVLKKCIHM